MGSHRQPWLVVGDAHRRAVPVGAGSGVLCSRGVLSPPGCQQGRVSLSYATGNSDGPSGVSFATRQEEGCLPRQLAAEG